MTPEEIRKFKREVADPCVKQLLSNITIPDGFCCINNLEMSFWDGRSYGAATQFVATGLQKRNGVITEYTFNEIDISCTEFVDAHKNCVFISDGSLKIYDQLENMTLTTDIGNLCYRCVEIFPQLADCSRLVLRPPSELLIIKMKELLVEQAGLNGKASLSEKIKSAASRVDSAFRERPAGREHEH